MAIVTNSHLLIGINMKSRVRPFLIIAAVLCFLLLTIWANLSASVAVKYIASVCATGILTAFVVIVYRNTVKERPSTQEPPVITERLPVVVPPRPIHAPRVAAPPSESEPEIEPILYGYRAKPIPAIGYSLSVSLLLGGLLVAVIHSYNYTRSPVVWYLFTICVLIGVTLCYWQWIVWRGRRLIITKSTKQLQRVLPWPFNSDAPSMPTKSGAAQNVKQTTIDRLLGTCRLYSDVVAKGDEVFHKLKWLPHADMLREAIGQTPLEKNSWWLFSKKDS